MKRALFAVVLVGCANAAPPPEPVVVGADTICVTVQPTYCKGMKSACGPLDRTAALVNEWCVDAPRLSEMPSKK